MNYLKIYNNIINRGKNRILTTYTESHHILPKCMGGTDDLDNLVKLTPEEHYVAHQLLAKIYPNEPKLIRAANMMIPNRPSNKSYGWLKKRLSEVVSKSQTGEGNSQFGTRWIHHRELKKSKKIKKFELLPEGWSEGRMINFEKIEFKEQKEKKQGIKKEEEINYLRKVMYYYRDNDISMRELTNKFNIGHNAYVRFERYFKEEYREIVKNKKGNSNISKGRYLGV